MFFFNISGTAQSVGCTIDKCAPHDLIDKINEGEIEVPDVSDTIFYCSR
jgi:large subunit ribosomal protein L12e